jgi:hypothetical protein
MVLNCDCIRDILLCIEEIVEPRKFAVFIDTELLKKTNQNTLRFTNDSVIENYQYQLLTKYSNKELIYHLNYCVKDKLIDLRNDSNSIAIIVENLTPKGHQLIANIRYDSVFEKTKRICKDLGVKSLSSFVQVAENVTSELIKSHFIS